MTHSSTCPVCEGACSLLDVLDFNKACGTADGKALAPAGIEVQYLLCSQCGFCFAPEIAAWTLEQFADKIYNDDYANVDPDYIDIRPMANARYLQAMFGASSKQFRHLDYGGGGGLLSAALKDQGWDSSSYDPFVNRDVLLAQLGQFDLISSFEVFEHVPDPVQLMADLRSLLAPGGVVVFSTLASDGHIHPGQPLSWWYAAPRNGHISLYSRHSLAILAHLSGLTFASFDAGYHVFFTDLPDWASHVLRLDAAPVADAGPQRGILARWLIRLVERLMAPRP